MSLAWAVTIRKLGSSWEAKKEESVRQCHFLSNFTLKLFLITQIFHPNLVFFFQRNKLRKCFISTGLSSHDGLTSPHQSYNPIHLEDVWYHHACLIHAKPCFFVLLWWSAWYTICIIFYKDKGFCFVEVVLPVCLSQALSLIPPYLT